MDSEDMVTGTMALVSGPTNFAILFGDSPKANRKGGRRNQNMTTWKKLVHSNPMTTSRSGTWRGSTFHPSSPPLGKTLQLLQQWS